jgi:hypothetical protein
MIEFDDVGNYRGNLQAKAENDKYYWRVDSEIDDEPWEEIPEYLYNALTRFHSKESLHDGSNYIGEDNV